MRKNGFHALGQEEEEASAVGRWPRALRVEQGMGLGLVSAAALVDRAAMSRRLTLQPGESQADGNKSPDSLVLRGDKPPSPLEPLCSGSADGDMSARSWKNDETERRAGITPASYQESKDKDKLFIVGMTAGNRSSLFIYFSQGLVSCGRRFSVCCSSIAMAKSHEREIGAVTGTILHGWFHYGHAQNFAILTD
ncbi:hypothetical protein AJ78_05025 [Emergomyces pasteurianus Ep9510]|uniref:Uncharacterized protein n=1 Tax=Emergomyces pasteurianus Ep9510 TaxID=1447872 RepID=A0A1J9PDQ6_9EURO|nr:hypothetical protein AJ78_05025 [Emergomyces pasteurianus Ep9510]